LFIRHGQQRGYTLIEIMVVIAVLALIATVAVGSINQTLNRRYSSEAEQLSIWLNQMSDMAVIQGAAFAVVGEVDQQPKKIEISSNDSELLSSQKKKLITPFVAFLPDGYVEPKLNVILRYENYEIIYNYSWDIENLQIRMDKKNEEL